MSSSIHSAPAQNHLAIIKEVYRQKSTDGTVKVLWRLSDGKNIESIVLDRNFKRSTTSLPPVSPRYTLCISSQVGCAMRCDFCLTGKSNLTRHLRTQEIVQQVVLLKKEFNITNVVFMGMGEPLHNILSVSEACSILLKKHGFSRRKVMISTSGIVPAIEKLPHLSPVRLAVSLNASNDTLRSKIMPINKRWNIKTLLAQAELYAIRVNMPVVLEYVLLAGVNDSLENANQLYELVKKRPFQVNLIPFNEFAGSPYKRTDATQVKAFQHALVSKGVTTTVRISGGKDILAACGQLNPSLNKQPADLSSPVHIRNVPLRQSPLNDLPSS